jgi:hypothetical protein
MDQTNLKNPGFLDRWKSHMVSVGRPIAFPSTSEIMPTNFLIAFYSRTGSTEALTNAVAEVAGAPKPLRTPQ